MADTFKGNTLQIIDENNDLKFKAISIKIKEKDAQVRQMELNKDKLEIERDKMVLQIDIITEEAKRLKVELDKLEPIKVNKIKGGAK